MVAAMLGKPLMEWQQYVADVILEIDPDTGRLAYDEYDLTVPRQSGKSTFILAKSTHRASATKFFGGRQKLVYTAQTRQKAREKWEEDFVLDLESSNRFKSKITTHRGNGNEHVRFANGSRFGIEANTEKAGHGGTLDEAYIDEAFAQVDNRLEQAFSPAMITRANKQLGVVSTAGWLDASPYLLEKVKLGRLLVEADVRRGTAYFEWSAPEDANPGDVEVWLSCMPALHRPDCEPGCRKHTVTIAAIQAEYDKAMRAGKMPDFRRAYLNQWVPKPVDQESSMIDATTWSKLVDSPDVPISSYPVFAVEMTKDQSMVSISSAGSTKAGKTRIEVAYHGSVFGAVDELARMVLEHEPTQVILDPKAPAGSLIADIRKAGINLTTVSAQEFAQACGGFFNMATDGTLSHLSDPLLNGELEAAKTKNLGDAWVWDRLKSPDITCLVAATLAAWGISQSIQATAW
jgi:phage terminase large subunit-like protein